MNRARHARSAGRDEGMVLVLTLLLVVVLGVLVMSLGVYTAAGLRTSRVAAEQTNGNAAASAALTWTLEELAAKRISPSDCDGGTLDVPAAVGSAVTLTCTESNDVNGSPSVLLIGAAAGEEGAPVEVQALVQVPEASYEVAVVEWNAVSSIDAEQYADLVVATTSPASTTTTTVASSPTTTVPGTNTTSTSSTTSTTTPPAAGEVTCAFTITSAWGSGGNGSLTITNGGSASIDGWRVAITHGGATISLWNASNQSSDESYFRAKNLGWNGSVPAGSTVEPTGGSVSGSGITEGQSFTCTVEAT